jgi:single-stranded-DNA-specific exonuclease
LYEQVKRLEPYGYGNPTPVFAAWNAVLLAPPRILKEKHLKLMVGQGASSFDALGWGMAARAAELSLDDRVDLAFTLDENRYMDSTTLQLIIKDIKKG